MPSLNASRKTRVVIQRLSRQAVRQAVEHRHVPCLMSPLSKCNNCACSACGGRRQDCTNDYQVLYDLVSSELITWEEAEKAGISAPRRRQTSKKVLATVLVVRKNA